MNDQQHSTLSLPDPAEISRSMAGIAEHSQRLVSGFLARQTADQRMPESDPLNIGGAFMEMTTKMMANPVRVMEANLSLWQDYLGLWQNTASRMMGQDTEPVVAPAHDDRRFRDQSWQENSVFDFIKQSYLLTSRWMQSTVAGVEGLDDETARKVDFYTRQFAEAMSPSNFLMTNPEVLRATMESGGENLLRGLENLLSDLERGDGKLRISMTDDDAFQVGENIATTPGKVVFRNELMELIQYTPATDKVRKVPLLIVPPWINKYYILDLREKNSFIKWAVDQGHTLFVISWVNPDSDLAAKTFADYMLEGPLAALDAIEQATGERKINAIGYCIGGTLMASTMAYLAANKDDRIKTITYLATMVDFEEAGELGVFIDEVQIQSLEAKMNEHGYLDGSEMASTFNMMRGTDLIWSFVVNNYLMGKDAFPFDLLYWNSDATRMPAAMHSFYLRNMYLNNKLVEPGGIELDGVPLDLSKITAPSYLISTREDHIAPWMSTYAATGLYQGPVRFVLSGSGHIAGIVNPPTAKKYGYWTNPETAATAEQWLEGATQHEGSWWPDWDKWVKKEGGGKSVPARQPGDGKLKPLCNAPGEYVLVKAGK